ncbi:nuclear transport factor 2 family protein [Nocardia lijiangensis]|uniref:nuclear transport factor 2 family protein n=1 Tax=Nocardia lijiangensis TaxID=299618 RepID=UPI0008327F87|nr:nuclear transport factor 2 family protein [Nocardia lijiangensis]
MDPAVHDVLDALAREDYASLRPLLHPHLRWTDGADTIHGRTKVLAHIAANPTTAPPVSYELRDGQIYRWAVPTEDEEAAPDSTPD